MEDRNNITQETDDEMVPVQVKNAIRSSMREVAQEVAAEEKAKNDNTMPEGNAEADDSAIRRMMKIPPAHRNKRHSHPYETTDEERLWAAIAHASYVLTLAVGITTGVGAFVTIFVPVVIYMLYRNKSEFVAHHALQAFAAQAIAIGGFLMLVLSITLAWVALIVISALLILVVIGIVLLPLVIVGGLIALAATLILPFGALIYSIIAAVEGFNGHNYSYPWIGDWVDDQLYDKIDQTL